MRGLRAFTKCTFLSLMQAPFHGLSFGGLDHVGTEARYATGGEWDSKSAELARQVELGWFHFVEVFREVLPPHQLEPAAPCIGVAPCSKLQKNKKMICVNL